LGIGRRALRMAKKTYIYAVIEHDETFEDGNSIEFDDWFDISDDRVRFIAEKAAEFDHGNRDGWECKWPLTYRIWDTDGLLLGTYSVDIEAVPEFFASRVSEEIGVK